MDMYFLKTGSPAHLRWLKVFELLMVITGLLISAYILTENLRTQSASSA